MKIQSIKSFFEDFSAFRKNRCQFELWLRTRKANLEVSRVVEEGVGKVHGQEFVVCRGRAYIVCECSDDNCVLGDFVDENLMMDVARGNTFIHKDCKTFENGRVSEVLGELGNFYVVRVIS